MRAIALIFAASMASAAAMLRKEGAAGVLDAKDSAFSTAASYDTLGAGCNSNSDCSNGEVCGTGGKCGTCNGVGGGCQNDSQCCTKSCSSKKECHGCNGNGGNCNSNGDCCSGYYCNLAGWSGASLTPTCATCRSTNAVCSFNGDCCSNTCSSSTGLCH